MTQRHEQPVADGQLTLTFHHDRSAGRRALMEKCSAAWLTAAMTGQILLAWLKLLALDGDLAQAEPRTLRYRVLHAAARLARGGRRRRLKIQATWPWAEAITIAWQRIDALPQAP